MTAQTKLMHINTMNEVILLNECPGLEFFLLWEEKTSRPIPTIHLRKIMVWFSFSHLERIKCGTYFPTQMTISHHAVEQFIILWSKTDAP